MEEQAVLLIKEYVGTFMLLSLVLVPFVTEAFFTYVWQPANKFINSVLVLLISVIVTFVSWAASTYFGVGFLAEINLWHHVLLYGLGAGAVAQWAWANVEAIHAIIQFLVTLSTNVFKQNRK